MLLKLAAVRLSYSAFAYKVYKLLVKFLDLPSGALIDIGIDTYIC